MPKANKFNENSDKNFENKLPLVFAAMVKESFTCVPQEFTDVVFGPYSNELIKKLSACKLTNPRSFDEVGNPQKGGPYDPALGPSDFGAKYFPLPFASLVSSFLAAAKVLVFTVFASQCSSKHVQRHLGGADKQATCLGLQNRLCSNKSSFPFPMFPSPSPNFPLNKTSLLSDAQRAVSPSPSVPDTLGTSSSVSRLITRSS